MSIPLSRRVFASLPLALVAPLVLAGASLRAQTVPTLAVVAPPWRPPVLQVAGAEQPVRLSALKVEVDVAGGVAETRVEMTFFNPNSRVLEGKLQFPLGAAQVVSGFALDVDGKLRDAVPVKQARAEQVFEDITRQRVDPGLLQSTQGNQYELRVYPLMPGKTRTVALRLTEPAAARLVLPLAYARSVPQFELALRYPSATQAPEVDAASAALSAGFAFVRDSRGGFVARTAGSDVVLPAQPLVVRSRVAADVEVTTESRGGESWFSLSLPVDRRTQARPLPGRVQIVWDQSASGANRSLDRELALLDAYFRRARSVEVTLVRVADTASPAERFSVRGGDWSALRQSLQATVYDGASRLGAVRHDGTSTEAIWFSDGLSNYGTPWKPAFPVPVYAVHSAPTGDPQALAQLAESSGGRFVDLAALGRGEAERALLERGSEVVEVSAVGARDLVLESRHAASGRIALAGAFTAGRAEVTLKLRGADGALSSRTLTIDATRNPGRLAATQWARLTLATLAGNTAATTQRASEIGQRFGIATRETSLLVLERVEDYARFEIVPPAELREAFERLVARGKDTRQRSEAERIARVAKRFEAKVAWWNRDFPKGDRAKAPLEVAANTIGGALGAGSRDDRMRRESESTARPTLAAPPAPTSPAPAARAAMPMGQGFAAADAAKSSSARAGGKDSDSTPGQSDIAIALKPASAQALWLQRLENADAATRRAVYLDERRGNAQSVGFFLEAADWFIARGEKENDGESRAIGLRALSNLAEMDLRDRQVLRLLGYRLGQAGEHALAVNVFERVVQLAPHEPQSHRDLGLALAERGEANDRQRAVAELYETVTGAWDGRFADVDLIALGELNALVAKAEREGRPLDTGAIDRRLLKNLPLDVRVVLAWDADATDVDLHVIDPNGEEVFYGHALSYQGGAISRDATGGYGPEEFALKVAKPGRYRIEANFYGHRQQVLTTSTGLMLWLTSGFGSAEESSKRTTLRLKSQSGQRVVVGEFEVKPRP